MYFIWAKNRTDWWHWLQLNLHRFSSFVQTKKTSSIHLFYPAGRTIGIVINFIQIYSDFVLNRFAQLACVWFCVWIKINETVSWPIIVVAKIERHWNGFLSVSIRNRIGNGAPIEHRSESKENIAWHRILHIYCIYSLRHCTRNLLILIKKIQNSFDCIRYDSRCCCWWCCWRWQELVCNMALPCESLPYAPNWIS